MSSKRTDDYVSISHNSVFNISSGTIIAYVKFDDITDNRYQRIISKKENWDDAAGYELEVNPVANTITFLAGGSELARGSFTSSVNWIQIVVTFSGTTATIYLNGSDITTDSSIGAVVDNSLPLWIGEVSGGEAGSSTDFN